MTTITFDISQFSIAFLLTLVGYCLLMGYSQKGKNAGWFLFFGGVFSFSLLSGIITMFSAVWLFLSPLVLVFSIKFMYDGLLQVLLFRKTEKEKRKRAW